MPLNSGGMVQDGTVVSERVVRTVANTTSSDVSELPVLYEAVDPEALDRLVGRMSNGEVSFDYAGHAVTVDSDGRVTLGERRTSPPSPEIAAGDH